MIYMPKNYNRHVHFRHLAKQVSGLVVGILIIIAFVVAMVCAFSQLARFPH